MAKIKGIEDWKFVGSGQAARFIDASLPVTPYTDMSCTHAVPALRSSAGASPHWSWGTDNREGRSLRRWGGHRRRRGITDRRYYGASRAARSSSSRGANDGGRVGIGQGGGKCGCSSGTSGFWWGFSILGKRGVRWEGGRCDGCPAASEA